MTTPRKKLSSPLPAMLRLSHVDDEEEDDDEAGGRRRAALDCVEEEYVSMGPAGQSETRNIKLKGLYSVVTPKQEATYGAVFDVSLPPLHSLLPHHFSLPSLVLLHLCLTHPSSRTGASDNSLI